MTQDSLCGSLTLIIGPMFAGKSTELIRQLERYMIVEKKVLAIAHTKDDRYAKNKIVTHDGKQMAALSVSKLMDNEDIYAEFDVIGIDEGQFYPDLYEFCNKYADLGKHIFVAGIQGDQYRREFGQMMKVIPICDKVKLLHAVCKRCGRAATFTHRKVASTAMFVVGGLDMYESGCRQCFLKMLEEKEEEFKK